MFLQTVFRPSPRQILEETMQDHVLATRRVTVLRSVAFLVVSGRIFRLLPLDIIENRNKETRPARGSSPIACYDAFQWDEQNLLQMSTIRQKFSVYRFYEDGPYKTQLV